MLTLRGTLKIVNGVCQLDDGTTLARLGEPDPLTSATAFLMALGFRDGDSIRVTGIQGNVGTMPVFYMASAEKTRIVGDAINIAGDSVTVNNIHIGSDVSGVRIGNIRGDVAVSDSKESYTAGPYRYAVWYATNREPNGSTSKFFTNRLERDGTLHYGKCLVDIPRTHQFGTLGTRWWKRWVKLQFEDDHIRLKGIERLENAAEFLGKLRSELATLNKSERQILVYLHGYNATFEEAALRAAQIGFDLKIDGVTAFFSWPSFGNKRAYFADADRIAASENGITKFLTQVAQKTGAENIHIIAHSMGNRGLARAMQRIFAKASAQSGLRFGHIILAAPDIEVTLFRELASIYPLYSKHTTMYVSARDKALGMSKWLQRSARAGFTPPITIVPGIDTIEVTQIDLTLLGHGYYAEADGVLRDMFDLIHFNARPEKRARTRAAPSGEPYWIIAR